jgi:hypothetical protein
VGQELFSTEDDSCRGWRSGRQRVVAVAFEDFCWSLDYVFLWQKSIRAKSDNLIFASDRERPDCSGRGGACGVVAAVRLGLDRGIK